MERQRRGAQLGAHGNRLYDKQCADGQHGYSRFCTIRHWSALPMGALGRSDVSVLNTAVNLTISAGVTGAIANSARLSLAGSGTLGVADVGYLQLNGSVETVGSLQLGSTLFITGIFSSALFPEYFSGPGSVIVGIVPEPGACALLAFGSLIGAAAWLRCRNRA